jgi:prepilin-type N-terminal cleavage/methylation domain-containing protein
MRVVKPTSRAAKPGRGFSLTEILVVIVIIAVLAAIAVLATGKFRQSGFKAQSASNLRQIGTLFQMYASDNSGMIPAVSSGENKTSPDWVEADPWWSQVLTPYVRSDKPFPRRWEIDDLFADPYLRALVGKNNTPGWRGGFSMNSRLGLARGDSSGEWGASQSRAKRLRQSALPPDAVLVTSGFYEGFSSSNEGEVAKENFAIGNSRPVAHNKRIGCNKQGEKGQTALYLLLDGSARELTPAEGARLLKLRPL